MIEFLPVNEFRARLKGEVSESKYEPVKDDPNTPANERRTYCNMFVRAVCRWFGWEDFEEADRDQAAEMLDFMDAQAQQEGFWLKLNTPMEAVQHANAGRLVIAGAKYPQPTTPLPAGGWRATGHVCIVAPEGTGWSTKWNQDVPMVANVGSRNFYGEKLSFAFPVELKDAMAYFLFNPPTTIPA